MTPPFQILPELNADDFNRLKSSIQARGVEVPVVVDEDGEIIDGHNRRLVGTNSFADVIYATIQPALGGGWFVTTVAKNSGEATFTQTAVETDLVSDALDVMGWVNTGSQWAVETAAPTSEPIMAGTSSYANDRPRTPRYAHNVVYFIQPVGGGPVKIGHSASPLERLGSLQAGCPFPLRILAVTDGGPAKEAALHRRFACHRVNGEWFQPHHQLLSYIEQEARPWQA